MIRFYLASSSPRRIQLLQQVGLKLKIIKPDVDEVAMKGEKPGQLVRRLAKEKAIYVYNRLSSKRQGRQNFLVLAADTIVVSPIGQKILGKPTSREDAFRMLSALSGKTHIVYTGYCLIYFDSSKVEVNEKSRWKKNPLKILTRICKTRVKMRHLDSETLRRYISSGEPMDKAGSYAAQGLGTALIEKIHGSYTNVVGLPVTQVLLDMERLTGTKLFEWTERSREAHQR